MSYSLEEELIDPFRAIRWISMTPFGVAGCTLGLLGYFILWWRFKAPLMVLWGKMAQRWISWGGQTWEVSLGAWPNSTERWIEIPKIIAPVAPPSAGVWWGFVMGVCLAWVVSSWFRPSLLPAKAFLRFVLVLVSITLGCMAVFPFEFRHSVEEWSKIYFLCGYGSLAAYGLIWIPCVVFFPLSRIVKWSVTLALIGYQVVVAPALLVFLVYCLKSSSLVLLPLLALLVAPILQLSWFVSFYAIALSTNTVNERGWER